MSDAQSRNDRDRILADIRAARGRIPEPEAYPDYVSGIATSAARFPQGLDPVELFRRRLEEAGGRCFDDPGELAKALQQENAGFGYCDPALLDRMGALAEAGLEVRDDFRRDQADDYAFSITSAHAGIAETGSLVLTDGSTSRRLAAVATWIHVAVLDPERIVSSLADGIATLPDDPNVVYVTGSSCTADVEGILIRGAHGPAEQFCLLTPP